jgi:hypothetical protein
VKNKVNWWVFTTMQFHEYLILLGEGVLGEGVDRLRFCDYNEIASDNSRIVGGCK